MKLPLRSCFKAMLAAALMLCGLLLTAPAQTPNFPAYTGHVNDFAGVMEAQTKQRLEIILTNFERLTGAQIAAVYIPSLNERPIEEYAVGLYRAWGIGAKSGENKNRGALLLVSIGDRRSRLEVGYGLEGDLPDGLAGELVRRMRPGLQAGQYSQAMEVGVRSIVDTLAEKWNINVEGIDRQYAYRGEPQGEELSGKAPLVLFGLMLLFFLFVSFAARRRGGGGRGGGGAGSNLWWLAPIIFNRGGGSFGGGSWGSSGGWGGGGGSGGGSDWGGFDGGSSGGGGASDSW